ncbi:hypothetical protein BVC80_8369g8 [Macleaya cordata]|uniref:Uncharacterized protein n=1 Tax=Macleaya cordata TaxID=56857 RepID=A0A200QJV0_MACCD|nr:hypothetical protein BVC80_8369g8 [Macleaya cordata]
MARIMGLKDEDIAFQEGTTRSVKGFDNGKKAVAGEFTTTIPTGWVRPVIREKIPSRFDCEN